MNVIEKMAYYQQVWKVALPHLPVPLPKDIRHWTDIDPTAVEAAILQASNRFAEHRTTGQFDVSLAYRWVTATARARAFKIKEAAQKAQAVTAPADVDGNRA
jgi:hypothetical protein